MTIHWYAIHKLENQSGGSSPSVTKSEFLEAYWSFGRLSRFSLTFFRIFSTHQLRRFPSFPFRFAKRRRVDAVTCHNLG
jgi:hypothetical protein